MWAALAIFGSIILLGFKVGIWLYKKNHKKPDYEKDKHQEYPHFDKSTRTIIYDMINNFKSRIKAKYSIGIPLALLFAERILNKMGLL